MELKNILAENIAKYRKEMKLTQAELAEKLNFSDKSISKWERGEGIPDVETLYKMAQLFGVSMDALTQEDSANVKPLPVDRKRSHIFITVLAVGLVWLVATVMFALLKMIPYNIPKVWLCFMYGVPVSAIVLVVFASIWGKYWQVGLAVSLLIWSLALSLYLTVNFADAWFVFIACIPLQILSIVWFIFKSYRRRGKK